MSSRRSLLAQLLLGPPRPATRLSELLAGAPPADPVDAMRASLPPLPTPDTRAGRPNRLAELTMPSPEFEPAVRPFGSPHLPAVTTPGEERRLIEIAMTLAPFVSNIKVTPGALRALWSAETPAEFSRAQARVARSMGWTKSGQGAAFDDFGRRLYGNETGYRSRYYTTPQGQNVRIADHGVVNPGASANNVFVQVQRGTPGGDISALAPSGQRFYQGIDTADEVAAAAEMYDALLRALQHTKAK